MAGPVTFLEFFRAIQDQMARGTNTHHRWPAPVYAAQEFGVRFTVIGVEWTPSADNPTQGQWLIKLAKP